MFKLNFFVPASHKEQVKEALFEIGVGRYENYEKCSWESLGVGQFQPTQSAHPYIGTSGKLEKVDEYKVEMICENTLIKKAVQTLKEVHPYEEVAYEVFKMEEI